jgi:bacillithiol system protein YtxJ
MGQKWAGAEVAMFEWITRMFGLESASTKEWEQVVELDTSEALASCLARSESEPVFIFKHSTRCPVSSRARSEVERYIDEAGETGLPVYLNYVVESRPVSNEIERSLGIRHESPQLFLLRAGKVVWHTSHGGIRSAAMVEAAESAQKSE